MHRRYDDGEPEADAGDEPRSHERRVAAAERHGERAGHEEEVGEYQRGAAERMDTSMYTFMEPAAVLLRQLVEKTQERRKEAPSLTSTTPPPERVHSDSDFVKFRFSTRLAIHSDFSIINP